MTEQTAPPILSTPESNIFEDPTAEIKPDRDSKLSKQEIRDVYEIERTAREVIEGGWRRVALQFPDGMLGDAPAVFEELEKELGLLEQRAGKRSNGSAENGREKLETEVSTQPADSKIRLAILADTSYGSCCVDEIAAEHVSADVVVHYGRACLSPTARLPVIYVYTSRPLELQTTIDAFEKEFEKGDKVIVMADLTYHSHVPTLVKKLQERGWNTILETEVIHNPTASIPNRKILWHSNSSEDTAEAEALTLQSYQIFHISSPPPALLLTLNSRIASLHIHPTTSAIPDFNTNTTRALTRRYGLLTQLTTVPIIGILINTLSVSNYLSSITTLRNLILAAGKKSYTFVVGKVNIAKMANFSEVGGWVVVGCWESSLLESREFMRPVVTPFELALALEGDGKRVWDGRWRGDFGVLEEGKVGGDEGKTGGEGAEIVYDESAKSEDVEDDEEEDSLPPEFDLRTGRPMHSHSSNSKPSNPSTTSNPANPTSTTLARRAKLDIATVNGTASPGAEYLRNTRTWQGLGSDFRAEGGEEDGNGNAGTVEEGRRGVARGYVVGDEEERT
ncbi:putative Diphthamide biosynthesis protein 2 [Glarea lozoyensis 74030]|uniref:2-(3-amino-3-carboxypropyl)histidine synthase subunit 2 n=1 Tax=Glarea lozoyensis (strain ATCC 74030 / MF5533) TaxID=1104152 RepID=H0ELE5_GLAL7|nr:putative Diphthamide biosynthesis protein 2 [Glarea lozoyensis 74030]